MNDRFQNVRMAAIALVFFLVIVGSVYVASYFYFGRRMDALNRMGQSIEVTRSYEWPFLAMLFQPAGRVEALITQRDVVVTTRPKFYGSTKKLNLALPATSPTNP